MNDSSDLSDQPDDEAELESSSPAAQSRFKAGPFIIVAVLITVFALIQVQRKVLNRAERAESEQRAAALANSAVGLTIERERGKPSPLFEVPWSPHMTVRDLMLDAQQAGQLTFEEAGEDDAAMLIDINGTKNEGGGADSFNWTYRVNGALGDKSFAIYELQKGDIVSWKFGPYE